MINTAVLNYDIQTILSDENHTGVCFKQSQRLKPTSIAAFRGMIRRSVSLFPILFY